MSRPLTLFATLVVCASPLLAQEPTKTTFVVYGNVGYVRNVSHFDPPVPGINQNGAAGSLRFMWQPGHLLSAGLEVGSTRVYSVEQQMEDGSTLHATLNAVPFLAVFSMSPWQHLHLNLGTGFAISKSSVSSLGNDASASGFGYAFMASAGYLFPVGTRFGVGGELKFLRMNQYDDNNLSLNLALSYRFK
jgi:hypothetical protein